MIDARRRTAVLVILFVGAFVMGTAEMLVIGVIELIADDLDVSVAAAGALVTANALGLAVGGPLLTLATARWDRRRVLLASVAAFAALNAVPLLLPAFAPFLLARIAIGAAQGLFIAAAISTATAVSEPRHAGRAMAAIISGSATASALGLPVGTLIGLTVGWRGAFAGVVAIAMLVLIAGARALPRVPAAAGTRLTGLVRDALAPRVLAVLAFCLVVFTAIQAALTYLVPLLADHHGIDGEQVGWFLAGYGIATTLGSVLGGRFADMNAARTLVVGSLGVTASLAALLASGGQPIVAWCAVFGVGLFGMGMAPSMQHRTVSLAGAGAALAASLPSSAVNAGIAAGAAAGGLALSAAGTQGAVQVAVAVSCVAVVVAAVTARIRPREDGGSGTSAPSTSTSTGADRGRR